MAPVNANANEYKSVVGLDSLYIALVTQDDAAGFVADTPEYLAPAAELTVEPTVNTATQYADNKAYETGSSEGETALNLTVTGIPPEMMAKLLGRVFDAASGRVFDNSEATPPYCALSYRSLKSNGKNRYYQYLKGRFQAPSEEAATKGDTPDYKPSQLVFTAVSTIHQFDLGGGITASVKRVFGDEDTTNFSPTGWFAQVQTPAVVAPAALALSNSTPADGAAAVAVGSDVVLTFNNALNAQATKNVALVKADGTAVAAAVTIDATKKIVTINPTGNLDAASTYIAVYAVVDIYGQSLSGAVNFGTA